MMKPTQRKDAVRNIRRRWLSFCSILLIVTLGITGFLWPLYVKQSFIRTGAGYYDNLNYHHLEMISSLGVTQSDLDTIRSNETVADVEGMRMAEGLLSVGEKNRKIQILSVTERISKPELKSGRVPAAAGECALGADLMELFGVSIGDSIRLEATDKVFANALSESEYTVVGCMNSPLYLRNNRTYYAFVSDGSFNESVLQGLYTRALVRFRLPKSATTFSSRYQKEVDARLASIRAMIPTMTERRSAEIRSEALSRLNSYRTEVFTYFDAMESVLQHSETLKAGEQKVLEALNQYKPLLKDAVLALAEFQGLDIDAMTGEILFNYFWDAAMTAYESTRDSMVEKYIPIVTLLIEDEDSAVSEEQLKQQLLDELLADENVQFVRKFLNQALSDSKIMETFFFFFDHVVSALDTELPEQAESVIRLISHLLPDNYAFLVRNYRSVLKMLPMMLRLSADSYLSDLTDAAFKKMLSEALDAVIPFAKGLAASQVLPGVLTEELANREKFAAVFEEAEKKIKGEESDLSAAVATLTANMTEREKKAFAKAGYDGPEQLVGNLSSYQGTPTWILVGRKDNVGYADYSAVVETMHIIAVAFASLFLILVVLVCFSSIAIMIDDQKKLIGATKSFGFFNREILSKYLLFGLLATIVGILIGIGLAFAVERALTSFFSGYYLFGSLLPAVDVAATVSVIIAILLLVAGTIWFACKGVLKRSASALLSGSADHEKRKHGKAVKAGTVRSRLILRNMRTELPRVLITCMIIVGCIILIGSGFSLKFSYDGMVDRQMNVITRYDVSAGFEKPLTEEDITNLKAAVTSHGGTCVALTDTTQMIGIDNQQIFVNLFCADPTEIQDFRQFHDFTTQKPIENVSEGILIQNRLQESYNLKIGSEVTVFDSSLNAHTVKISGVFQNYLGRSVFFTPDAYRNLFGADPAYNTLYIRAEKAEMEALKEEIRAIRSDTALTQNDMIAGELGSFSTLINIVVVVLSLVSILMLFMILINFTGIYLNRRVRDLTVMRINGFSMKQCIGYLIRETVLTNLIGIVFGVLAGIFVARTVILGIEQPYVQFIRTPNVIAWVIAVTAELIFAAIINFIVFRRVKRLKLTDL